MHILVVSATPFEVAPCAAYFNDQQQLVEFLYTGVGMVQSTLALSQRLMAQKYDLVIHAGIAGGFDKNTPLGSVFQLVEDVFSELGAEDHDTFLDIEALGFGKATTQAFFPEEWQHLIPNLPKVKGITVNTVHGNAASIQEVKTRFPQAALETMESAAVMYVCEQFKLPCLSLRSTSNYVEPRQRELWNISLALEKLNQLLIQVLNQFQNV